MSPWGDLDLAILIFEAVGEKLVKAWSFEMIIVRST